ncbi:hypothetical protein [Burkholderia vietnamiensis]|uniref:hypothetical protein n=1 Tax=Burkholderia vietnamiensis TaxID=60552 RepID=UPI00264F532E|nr:hypothetical protein [Burkholderia vietnamiensis]MDN8066193.1 hypothetical protein [Burkholderia vietnamiensis]
MAERTKAQQVDQAGYTRRDLATLQKKRVGGCARSIGPKPSMITYAILTNTQDEPLGYMTTDHVPSLEELADHIAIAEGYPTRDDWIIERRIDELAFAPVH